MLGAKVLEDILCSHCSLTENNKHLTPEIVCAWSAFYKGKIAVGFKVEVT